MKVQIKALPALNSAMVLPAYQSAGAAGLDLRANCSVPVTLAPGEAYLMGTGYAVYLEDPGYAAMLLPRSGLGHKHGIVLGNLVGLIDSDYQGQIMVSVWNRSEVAYEIQALERIAQLVIVPVVQAQLNVVDVFKETQRGTCGFGSTGGK